MVEYENWNAVNSRIHIINFIGLCTNNTIPAENIPLVRVRITNLYHGPGNTVGSINNVNGPIVEKRKKTATESWRISFLVIVFRILLTLAMVCPIFENGDSLGTIR